MEQTNTHKALKISAVVAIIVAVLFIISYALGSFEVIEDVPVPTENTAPVVQDDSSDDVTIVTVPSTSTVESDIDAFINSSGSVPSSSDFNDSYSDLNQ